MESGDLISLLRSKNRCLERLMSISERYLASNSAASFDEPALISFQDERDALFKVMSLHDGKVTELLEKLTPAERTPELIASAQREIDEKDRLVQLLIALDNQIMESLEKEKSRVLETLAATRKGQAVVSKFKSEWVPESGEELDQKC